MNDIEDALRTMLRTRAEDIMEMPAHLADLDLASTGRVAHPRNAPRSGGNRRWLLGLVAAAAVAIVAVGVTIGLREINTSEPAHPRPTTHTTPPPTPAQRCTTALPSSWREAIADGTVTAPPGWVLPPLLVGAYSGSAVAVEYTTAFPRTYKLVMLTPHQPTQTLYEAPFVPATPEAEAAAPPIAGVAVSGDWLAFIAADAAGQQLEVKLMIVSSRTLRTIRTMPARTSVLGGTRSVAISNNGVYWVEQSAGQSHGRLYRYHIPFGPVRVLDRHVTSGLLDVDQGAVFWNRGGRSDMTRPRIDIGSDPPTAFRPPDVDWAHALAYVYPVLITGPDGTYFWRNTAGAVMAVRPGSGAPVRLEPARKNASPLAVTGHFLWSAGVIDLRTGAATRLGATPDIYASTDATAVLAPSEVSSLVVLDATRLSELHC